MNAYDVYLGLVPYEEDEELPTPRYKLRPIAILDQNIGYLLSVVPITSHNARNWDAGDYEIIDWREAGLRKPSTARLGNLINLNRVNIERKIGRLTTRDINNISEILGELKGELREKLQDSGETIKQAKKNFKAYVKTIPHIAVLPKEWYNPEDDIYDELYRDDFQ